MFVFGLSFARPREGDSNLYFDLKTWRITHATRVTYNDLASWLFRMNRLQATIDADLVISVFDLLTAPLLITWHLARKVEDRTANLSLNGYGAFCIWALWGSWPLTFHHWLSITRLIVLVLHGKPGYHIWTFYDLQFWLYKPWQTATSLFRDVIFWVFKHKCSQCVAFVGRTIFRRSSMIVSSFIDYGVCRVRASWDFTFDTLDV